MTNSNRTPLDKHLIELHDKACEKGKESYVDPVTGYLVFTKIFHLKKGQCCQNGCRHCPWLKNQQSDSK